MKNHLVRYTELHKSISENLVKLKEVQEDYAQVRSSFVFCYDDEEDYLRDQLDQLRKMEENVWGMLKDSIDECKRIDITCGEEA